MLALDTSLVTVLPDLSRVSPGFSTLRDRRSRSMAAAAAAAAAKEGLMLSPNR